MRHPRTQGHDMTWQKVRDLIVNIIIIASFVILAVAVALAAQTDMP